MSTTKEQNKNNKINFKEISSNYLLDSDNSKISEDNAEQNISKYHVLINFDKIENINLKKDLKSFLFDKNKPNQSIAVRIYEHTYLLKKRLNHSEIEEILIFIERLFIYYGNDIEHEVSIAYFPNGKTIISKSE